MSCVLPAWPLVVMPVLLPHGHHLVTFRFHYHWPRPPSQVRLKANALVQFVGAQHGAQRTYALLTLSNKLISQCEVQVGAAACTGSGEQLQ